MTIERRPKYHFYLADDGWRWQLYAANGNIISQSTRGYSSEYAVRRAISSHRETSVDAEAVHYPTL